MDAATLLKALTLLLIVGYVGINFAADLPRFLVAENLLLAAAYAAGLYGVTHYGKPAFAYLALLAGFNAGRVSRSIVGPRGELGDLALEHVPLLLLILAVGVVSAYLAAKT